MRLCFVGFTRRQDGFHHFRDHKVEAVRVGDGYGVLISFEPSQIDRDFKDTLYANETGLWAPSQDELDRIQWFLDESDYRTSELLGQKSWSGRRPFRLEEFM